MKRHILLPTDFSNNAENAIKYAIDLFKMDVCDFYILNIYDIEAYTMELTAADTIEKSKQKSMAGLAHTIERLSITDDSHHHQFYKISEFGSLIDNMKAIIAQRDIDMVVMGTKGDTDARTQIYGSQTVLAMEKIRNCPVLAIPAKAKFKNIKQIVFPTGYRTPYKKREFQYLVDIAKRTGAAVRILHVLDIGEKLNQDQRHKQNLLKDYFEGLDYSFHTEHSTDVQAALHTFIESHAIDMVVFINKTHSFFSRIFSRKPPMMKALGYHSTIPILALHDFRT